MNSTLLSARRMRSINGLKSTALGIKRFKSAALGINGFKSIELGYAYHFDMDASLNKRINQNWALDFSNL